VGFEVAGEFVDSLPCHINIVSYFNSSRHLLKLVQPKTLVQS